MNMEWLTRHFHDQRARHDGSMSRAGAASIHEAIEQYNRDNRRDWGRPGNGTCPICGHKGCFGRAGGKLANSGRWSCWSANHGRVGVSHRACVHGDALDIDAHQSGRSRVAHLIATGYLVANAPDTRQQKPQHEAPSAVGCRERKVAAKASANPSAFEEEFIEERAAILEYEAGMNRHAATELARKLWEATRARAKASNSDKGVSHLGNPGSSARHER